MLSLRLALRQVASDRRRFLLLVAAMIVPILAISAWFTLRHTAAETPEIRTTQRLGNAQVELARPDLLVGSTLSRALERGEWELRESDPALAEAVPRVTGTVHVSTDDAEVVARLSGHGAAELSEGYRILRQGQLPSADDEVVLSAAAFEALAVDIGDLVKLGDDWYRVVGVQVSPLALDTLFVTTSLETGLALLESTKASDNQPAPTALEWLVGAPLQTDTLNQLEADGWDVTTRAGVLALAEHDAFDVTNVYLALMAFVFLGELLLIFSGVYAIVFRGRVREQGLLSAVGAPRRLRLRIAMWDGLLVGITAAALGISGGVLLARLAMQSVAASANLFWTHLLIPYGWLATVAGLMLLSAGGAAWLASRHVTSDVVAALHGRSVTTGIVANGATKIRHIVIWVGVGTSLCLFGAIGRVSLLVYAGIGVLMLAGLHGLTRWYSTGNPRLIRGLNPRLAWRSTAFEPRRFALFATVPLSLIALLTVLAAVLGTAGVEARQQYTSQGPDGSVLITTTQPLERHTLMAVRDILGAPGAALFAEVAPTPVPLDERGIPFTYWGVYEARDHVNEAVGGTDPISLFTVPAEDVEVWLGRSLSADEEAAFQAGHVLSMIPHLVRDGQVELSAPRPGADDGGILEVTIPALAVGAADGRQRGFPMLVIAPEAATALGVPQPTLSTGYLAPGDAVPDERDEARARAALAADVGRSFSALEVERGPQFAQVIARIMVYSLLALLVATLAVAVIMSAVARHEQRSTLAALSALGADRRKRAWMLAWQNLMTLGCGAGLGALVGGVGAVAGMAAVGGRFTWWPLGAMTVGVVAVLLVAWGVGALAGLRPLRALRAP